MQLSATAQRDAAVGGGAAIIPGTKKVGGPGSSITVPITNKDNIFFFPHMDATFAQREAALAQMDAALAHIAAA